MPFTRLFDREKNVFTQHSQHSQHSQYSQYSQYSQHLKHSLFFQKALFFRTFFSTQIPWYTKENQFYIHIHIHLYYSINI